MKDNVFNFLDQEREILFMGIFVANWKPNHSQLFLCQCEKFILNNHGKIMGVPSKNKMLMKIQRCC